jgi:hypothetical protein
MHFTCSHAALNGRSWDRTRANRFGRCPRVASCPPVREPACVNRARLAVNRTLDVSRPGAPIHFTVSDLQKDLHIRTIAPVAQWIEQRSYPQVSLEKVTAFTPGQPIGEPGENACSHGRIHSHELYGLSVQTGASPENADKVRSVPQRIRCLGRMAKGGAPVCREIVRAEDLAFGVRTGLAGVRADPSRASRHRVRPMNPRSRNTFAGRELWLRGTTEWRADALRVA